MPSRGNLQHIQQAHEPSLPDASKDQAKVLSAEMDLTLQDRIIM